MSRPLPNRRSCPGDVSGVRILSALALTIVLFASMVSAAFAGRDSESSAALFQENPSPTPTLPIGTFAPPIEPLITPVPPYAPLAETPEGHDVLNILLMGSDTEDAGSAGRTDALMIVSLNRTAGTASLLSIPRDLLVYIPGWTMQRINTAFGHGAYGPDNDVEDGYEVLDQTILYNFGIPIHFHARIDFAGFRQIIDALGGIEITVDCILEDWRLTSPELDPEVEDNWEWFTLPIGVHQMNGDMALWYARSRNSTSDFDRGRRQQDLMRAMWRRLVELGLLNQLPELWGQITEVVETDMQLADVIGLAPLAASIDSSQIAHYTFRANEDVHSWRSPQGASVQLPIPDRVQLLIHNFMQPPTENRLVQGGPRVEVLNASNYTGLDRVAADRLAWEGFFAIAGGEEGGLFRPESVIYDYTGRTKGSSLDALLETLRMPEDVVIVEPDPDRTVDYRVVLGGSYQSCTHTTLMPTATPPPPVAAENAGAGS